MKIPQILTYSTLPNNRTGMAITEKDGRKLNNIYIDVILKTIVVLVFTRSLAYLNGNATSHRHSKFKYWSIYGTFLKS